MPDDPPPNRKAVALRYNIERDQAPRMIAKGQGYVADKILELADEHNIPLHNDPQLTAVLSKLDINHEIPEHLYKAVAEVLAFVYRLNESMK